MLTFCYWVLIFVVYLFIYLYIINGIYLVCCDNIDGISGLSHPTALNL